ncbi:DNA-directed RNA polymerase subunit omega [Kamptonema cortianum]|nr:DNA-directed RNA polymerase subunit omega [Geitlerinema splendidum]MDK3158391.1 DNA-directed RNA polymerase subunit omega [Kamptonema cortianum]
MNHPHEKILPAPDTLNEVEYGRFVLTNLAAKRAKQIKEGAPPLVRIDTNHPLSIALAEIAAGKIKPILGSDAQAAELEDDYSALDELGLDDVGLLLPLADDDTLLEDSEDGADLDDFIGLDEDEEDDEDDEDSETASVADLLDDDETETTASDDTEISLDDLAEEEEAGSDDSDESDA